MTGTKSGWWAALLGLGVLSLALNLWQVHHQTVLRRELWPLVCQPCVADAAAANAAMEAGLAARRMGKAERKAYDEAMGRLRACSQKLLSVQPATSSEAFYEPLDRLIFWQTQALQLGEDSLRLDRRTDASMLRTAVKALHGMQVNQVRCAVALGRSAVKDLDLQGADLASAQAWAGMDAR